MAYPQLAHALLHGKPYFGTAMRSLQGDPARHQYFLPVVRRIAALQDGPISILEVGSWAGASTVSWAKAIQEVGREGRVTSVDPWMAYFDETHSSSRIYSEMNESAKNGDIFKLFLYNLEACGIRAMVDYHVGDSRRVLPQLQAGAFDIIYIDGDHSYAVVASDIREAKRLLKPQGILCGDDLEVQCHEIDRDTYDADVKSGLEYVRTEKTGMGYHPGVTGAIAHELGKVSVWQGFWASTHSPAGWGLLDLDTQTLSSPLHIQEAVEFENSRILESTFSFNLIKVGDGYVALAKSLGPTHLLVERLGERDLSPNLFVSDNLEELRQKVSSAESSFALSASRGLR